MITTAKNVTEGNFNRILLDKRYEKRQKIILNPLLIRAPKEAIDYVITHEFCHMKYKNHDSKFYELMELKFPGWHKTKEKLEQTII